MVQVIYIWYIYIGIYIWYIYIGSHTHAHTHTQMILDHAMLRAAANGDADRVEELIGTYQVSFDLFCLFIRYLLTRGRALQVQAPTWKREMCQTRRMATTIGPRYILPLGKHTLKCARCCIDSDSDTDTHTHTYTYVCFMNTDSLLGNTHSHTLKCARCCCFYAPTVYANIYTEAHARIYSYVLFYKYQHIFQIYLYL